MKSVSVLVVKSHTVILTNILIFTKPDLGSLMLLSIQVYYTSNTTIINVCIYMYISIDKLNDGYNILRTIVMAYGGITPDTPLTLSLSASRPTTRQTSSSLSSYDILIDDDDTSNPNTAMATNKPHLLNNGELSLSMSAPVANHRDHTCDDYSREYQQQLNTLAQSWSRPSTSQSDNQEIELAGIDKVCVYNCIL